MWLLNFSCLHVSFRIWYRVITRVLPHLLGPRSSGQPPNCSLFLSLSAITIASHDQIISLSLAHLGFERTKCCRASDGTRLLALFWDRFADYHRDGLRLCADVSEMMLCSVISLGRAAKLRGHHAAGATGNLSRLLVRRRGTGNARAAGGPLWAPSPPPGSLVALSQDNPL